MNKEFLLIKQRFIESLLSRYTFWDSLIDHNLQIWRDRCVESSASCIIGMPMPIVLSPLEHLTIMPLVFDYLDVTISLKFGLSDEPFKAKQEKLSSMLGCDLISQLTVSTYEKLYKIRNKLLHQKGAVSECGKKIIIIKDDYHVDLASLKHINGLAVKLTKNLKVDKFFCLYEKSIIWSSYNLAFPNPNELILNIASSENVISIHLSYTRFIIDMRPTKIENFEELKTHLLNRFLTEEGQLISNSNFLFKYQGIEYSIPGEFLCKNSNISMCDIGIWATEQKI